MEKNYQTEMIFAKRTAVEAYGACKNSGSLQVSSKGGRDLVTNLDIAIENTIVRQIRENFPNDSILAEEQHAGEVLDDSRHWCLDPIDGTVNLARGIPFYGVQIALIEHKKPAAAAIYLPEMNEVYYASLGGGSFLNAQRLSVSAVQNPAQAIVSFGDFSKKDGENLENERRARALGGLAHDVLKIIMFGAAFLDLAYLSRGLIDAHIMFSFGLWDVLPGLLIAAEAGACYKTARGAEFTLDSKDIILASSEPLLDFVVERFKILDI